MYDMTARRARSSLTPEEILDAAEAVMAGSVELLTMRAVATELGASPMSMYRYFATKDELVDALLDRVLGRVAVREPTDDWAEDLRRFAQAHRDVLAGHPWAVLPLFTHPNPGPSATRIGELAFAILARGGVAGVDAVVAFSGILALNYGWAAFSLSRPDAQEKDHVEQMAAALASLPADYFPHTVAVAVELAQYGSQDHYDRALDQLLVGVRAAGS
jgi:AcrR family transcriptional regulator